MALRADVAVAGTLLIDDLRLTIDAGIACYGPIAIGVNAVVVLIAAYP